MSMILRLWQLAMTRFVLFLFRVFCRLEVHGTEHLQHIEKPFLITPNHKSMVDPFVVGAAILQTRTDLAPLHFMTKDKLFTYPVLNLFLWSLGAFRANKKQGLDRSLKTPSRLLHNGAVVMVFPEAHIMPDRTKLGHGRNGAAILASATGVPIVPVSFYTSEFLTLGNFFVRRPQVVVRIGVPFAVRIANPSRLEESLEEASSMIMGKVADLYRQDEPELHWRG